MFYIEMGVQFIIFQNFLVLLFITGFCFTLIVLYRQTFCDFYSFDIIVFYDIEHYLSLHMFHMNLRTICVFLLLAHILKMFQNNLISCAVQICYTPMIVCGILMGILKCSTMVYPLVLKILPLNLFYYHHLYTYLKLLNFNVSPPHQSLSFLLTQACATILTLI